MWLYKALLCCALVDGFEVLDVGAPRSGTQTLANALKLLGYKALHSGMMREKRQPWCDYIYHKGNLEPALASLEGYDAAMDEPFHLVYREIMAAFPEAKFIYTIRDPESWFASYDKLMAEMIAADQTGKRTLLRGFRKMHLHVPDELRWAMNLDIWSSPCTSCNNWGCRFGQADSHDAKAECLANYEKHFQTLKQVIPKDRLLVFNMTDGWAPLCKFLQKPIPPLPFPHDDGVGEWYDEHFNDNGTSLVQSAAARRPARRSAHADAERSELAEL
ncbi:unnamed protein product [Durusdinium trenchii]|uniref:Protein-tyrosine sulfotransferase n=1 Tax=Durusdinium trenchii TaxID=1381693 RepID=A0ABP0KIP0_9DINO